MLIRNCFGRHAWTLQLRHLPRHRSSTKQNFNHSMTAATGRPISMVETSTTSNVFQRYFPDCINHLEAYKADKSISSLESVSGDDNQLESLIEQQFLAESETQLSENDSFKECSPPSTCQEYFTARMFLCHLGLLSKFRSNGSSNSSEQDEICSLVALNNETEGFVQDLKLLDQITTKTCDTCRIFYMKTGQKSLIEVLENTMSRSEVCLPFIELLYSLGWPVQVDQLVGWTGYTFTSRKTDCHPRNSSSFFSNENVTFDSDDGVCLYDGLDRIIYWCDAISEMGFIVPSLRHLVSPFNTGSWFRKSVSVSTDFSSSNTNITDVNESDDKMRTFSLDGAGSEKPQSGNVFSKKKSNFTTAVMLVWLESFEDHLNFPLNDVFLNANSDWERCVTNDPVRDCFIIFLHPLQNGLLKVKLQGPANKMNIAIPLVDGMIISQRSAGQLVRQTVINIYRRRRLDCDSYHLPHVCRRLKLQEIKEKFECKMDPPELLTYLLKKC